MQDSPGSSVGTVEAVEWRDAVAELSEIERAPYDDPHVYSDTHGSGCGEP
jgi:hypothetical protein